MTSRISKKRLLQVLREQKLKLSALAPVDGIKIMLEFYRDERVEGCSTKNGGDMLLYEWGCYDWDDEEMFELSITRQMIDGKGEDEDIRQLRLTFSFSPTDDLRKLGDGERWCDTPKEQDKFRKYLWSSKAMKAVAESNPHKIKLELDIAG